MHRYIRAGSIALALALGLAAGALPAGAQGMGGTPPATPGLFQNKVVVPPGDTTVYRPPAKIITPGGMPIPVSPYSYPAYSAYSYVRPVVPGVPAAPRRFVQGYWAQQWVPQYYTYNAWVPGYFDENGLWNEGYYETQVAQAGGFYQNVWVPGYWTQ